MNSKVDPEKLTDRELLLVVHTLLENVIDRFENHLRHHWAVTLLALSAGLVGAINLCIGLVLILVKA